MRRLSALGLLLAVSLAASAGRADEGKMLWRRPAEGHAKGRGARVLVYFGTFDPFHEGHHALTELGKKLGFDEVLLAPNGDPPLKSDVTPIEHRMRMIKKRVEGEPGVNIFLHDNTRFITDKEAFVRHLRKEYGKSARFTMLFGADAFERGLEAGTIRRDTSIPYVVVERGGHFDRRKIPRAMRDHVKVVGTPVGTPTSGSKIRRAFAQGRRVSTKELSAVEQRYIRKHRLYRPRPVRERGRARGRPRSRGRSSARVKVRAPRR